jgi:hypothetical protein
MEDDLFDIIGLSLFTCGGKWCLLDSVTCRPSPSCDDYRVDGRCPYKHEEDEEENPWR